jgi:hypothetical protein
MNAYHRAWCVAGLRMATTDSQRAWSSRNSALGFWTATRSYCLEDLAGAREAGGAHCFFGRAVAKVVACCFEDDAHGPSLSLRLGLLCSMRVHKGVGVLPSLSAIRGYGDLVSDDKMCVSTCTHGVHE